VTRSNKKSHVPEWAWREYVDYFGAPETGAIFQIIEDNNCAKVWRAISREEEPENRALAVRLLLHEVESALQGPSEAERHHAKAREDKGATIARLANELRRELVELANEDGYPPQEFTCAYRQYSTESSRSITAYRRGYEDLVTDESSRAFLREVRNAVKAGFMGALLNDCPALGAIEQGGIAWRNKYAFFYRPNEDNVEYLYFIHRISDFFEAHYGKPLQASTAALTNCVFDTHVLDSQVTNLRKTVSRQKAKKSVQRKAKDAISHTKDKKGVRKGAK